MPAVDWPYELRKLLDDMTTPALLALVRIRDGDFGAASDIAEAAFTEMTARHQKREPSVTDEDWQRREDMVLALLNRRH
jgi:hypothetical protein